MVNSQTHSQCVEGDVRERTDNVEVEGDLWSSHDGMIEWSNHEFNVVNREKCFQD